MDWAAENLGLSWPWPREIYGAVASFCRRTGVRSLGFDVIYSEPSAYGVADDTSFGNELARSGNVANAAVLGIKSGQVKAWPSRLDDQRFKLEGMDILPSVKPGEAKVFTGVTLPVPEVAESSAVLCNVNLAPDPDGIYRKVPLFTRFRDQALPSLGLGLYLAAHPGVEAGLFKNGAQAGMRINGLSVPMDEQGGAVLNYRGPSGTHAVYSAAWVIQSELQAREGASLPEETMQAFRDKYVFFGFSAPGLFDIHSTPVDSQFPGVEIHATLLDNLLSGDFIRETPFRVTLVFSIILVLCCGGLTALYTRALPMFSLISLFMFLPVGAGFAAYAGGVWLPVALPLAAVVVTIALALIVNYATEGRQRRFIKNAFHHYLSPHVIDQILMDPDRLSLGGERRTLSIFFSDLESFTTVSKSMEPEALTRFLNRYLTAMTDIIHRHGGTIDKYEGDAIIAFWNAPLDTPDHAEKAVRTALDCQAKLAEMRPELKIQTGHEVRMRIGINTGTAVVGNLGSATRFDYTMIGDAVNLAARLESANKEFGTYTMVSRATRDVAGEAAVYRPLGRIRVKGKKKSVPVFEPMGKEVAAPKMAMISGFEEGLRLYRAGRFRDAGEVFSKVADTDPAARVYADTCRRFAES
ncbi:MAG: adenylate/guanylate cyclase domain-containing protein, partial [Desulfobacterales bacterium]|nr:adenylate/guanylate cyclase domain-containing protein [Desulfobacterales bacterium]